VFPANSVSFVFEVANKPTFDKFELPPKNESVDENVTVNSAVRDATVENAPVALRSVEAEISPGSVVAFEAGAPPVPRAT
jgi:hypothetical protein